MPQPQTTIPLNRGSDITLLGTYTNPDDSAFDLTGWTLEAFEADSALDLTITIEDAAAGQIKVVIQWLDAYETGSDMTFRIRATKDGDDISSPLIVVRAQ